MKSLLGTEKAFIEKISGGMDRPQLKAMLDYVREGDTPVVESHSRLVRNTKDLLSIVEELERKGVAFVSLKENIDTSTHQGGANAYYLCWSRPVRERMHSSEAEGRNSDSKD